MNAHWRSRVNEILHSHLAQSECLAGSPLEDLSLFASQVQRARESDPKFFRACRDDNDLKIAAAMLLYEPRLNWPHKGDIPHITVEEYDARGLLLPFWGGSKLAILFATLRAGFCDANFLRGIAERELNLRKGVFDTFVRSAVREGNIVVPDLDVSLKLILEVAMHWDRVSRYGDLKYHERRRNARSLLFFFRSIKYPFGNIELYSDHLDEIVEVHTDPPPALRFEANVQDAILLRTVIDPEWSRDQSAVSFFEDDFARLEEVPAEALCEIIEAEQISADLRWASYLEAIGRSTDLKKVNEDVRYSWSAACRGRRACLPAALDAQSQLKLNIETIDVDRIYSKLLITTKKPYLHPSSHDLIQSALMHALRKADKGYRRELIANDIIQTGIETRSEADKAALAVHTADWPEIKIRRELVADYWLDLKNSVDTVGVNETASKLYYAAVREGETPRSTYDLGASIWRDNDEILFHTHPDPDRIGEALLREVLVSDLTLGANYTPSPEIITNPSTALKNY